MEFNLWKKRNFLSISNSREKILVAIEKILKTLIENKCYSFVSVIKYLGFNDGFNSFGIKGFTLVFDFPLYRNIDLILRKIDQIVIKYGGRIYL